MTRRIWSALALVILAGAAVRFATLDVQSLWFDEAVTAQLLRMHLGGLLHAIPDSESTPPLYYLLAWAWAHAWGTGEAGMRSLSALLGTLTIPVAWTLGRRLGGARAALAAAALLASNPLLVWFSQEARSYALLVLLAALSALLWLRALDAPGDARRLLAWGAVAALSLATHYYALFLVAPQALWLLARAPGTRARVATLAVPVAAAAALAPLALAQRANDSARFIADIPLSTRIAQVPKQFLVGYDAPAETALTILSAIVMIVAIGGVVAILAGRVAAPAPARSDASRLAAIVLAALALPILASIAGEDHLLSRNLVGVLPLAAALAGAGLAGIAHALPRTAAAGVAAACLLGLVAIGGVARDPRLQRDDWRGAARALGPAVAGRLIVAPGPALVPLGYYVAGLRTVPATGAPPAAELDYVDLSERTPGELATPRRGELPPPVAGFAIAARTDGETFTVVRLRATASQAVAPAALARGLDGRPALVFTTR
jgi:uncharacterized membrane protein